MPIAESKICSKDSLSLYSERGSTSRRPPFSQHPSPAPAPEWHPELIDNSHLTWKLKRPFTSVRDGKRQEWIQEPYEEQAAEGHPVHDDGKKSGWVSAPENFRLSSLRDCPFYLSSCDLIRPLQKKKKMNLLAREAERQSLCIDVIFQSNNS